MTERRGRPSLRDLLDVGTVGLRTRPLRAVLSTLGIAIGIATLVTVTAVPASSQAALDDRLTTLGADLLRAGAAADDAADLLGDTMLAVWRRAQDVPDGKEGVLWVHGVAPPPSAVHPPSFARATRQTLRSRPRPDRHRRPALGRRR
jgi:hypothetical protein